MKLSSIGAQGSDTIVVGRITTADLTAAVAGREILAILDPCIAGRGSVGCDTVVVESETVDWGTGVCDTIVVGCIPTADLTAAVAGREIIVCNHRISAVAVLDPCIAGRGSAGRSSTGALLPTAGGFMG